MATSEISEGPDLQRVGRSTLRWWVLHRIKARRTYVGGIRNGFSTVPTTITENRLWTISNCATPIARHVDRETGFHPEKAVQYSSLPQRNRYGEGMGYRLSESRVNLAQELQAPQRPRLSRVRIMGKGFGHLSVYLTSDLPLTSVRLATVSDKTICKRSVWPDKKNTNNSHKTPPLS